MEFQVGMGLLVIVQLLCIALAVEAWIYAYVVCKLEDESQDGGSK